MNVRTPRMPALGLVAALTLLATGCGGGPAASSESGASLVRADALAYVAIDTDLGSGQWKQLDDLSKRFPGRDLALEKLDQALAKHGVDFDQDVEPAVGPEVDVAVVSGGTEETTKAVALTQPRDAGKLTDLISKLNAASSDTTLVYRELDDGWYAVSDSRAAIDEALAGDGPTLEGDSTFEDAFQGLPDEALVKAYANGHQLGQLVVATAKEKSKNGNPLGSQMAALQKLDSLSASLTAEDDGVRVRGAAKGAGADEVLGGGNFDSKLLANTPGDALAFLTFRGGSGLADTLQGLSSPLTGLLGISANELASLLESEVALYVRPGIGIPEITLALDSSAEGLATLDKLASRIAQMTGGKVVESGSEKTLTIGGIAIHYGSTDGKIVVTTATNGVAGYGASDEKLADSADFKEAKSAAGMPDSNAGFAYIDLKNAIPLILGLAGLAGALPSPVVTENLRPLRSLLAWSEGQGNSRSFDLFLEIK